MNLQSNDFEIFGLSPAFALDRQALDERWKDLQRQAHPDRHASADAATQRQAMQWSVPINEAYQRLKDPVKRAAYLCELNGAPIQAENNTAMPADFLMQQMEWRGHWRRPLAQTNWSAWPTTWPRPDASAWRSCSAAPTSSATSPPWRSRSEPLCSLSALPATSRTGLSNWDNKRFRCTPIPIFCHGASSDLRTRPIP